MLIKMGPDLFRVLDLQHVTPGNLRGFVRAKFRNIRNGSLSDQKLRSEDFLERAVLDEREMQYLYKDGDSFHFMDTSSYEQLQAPNRSASSSHRPSISRSRTRPRASRAPRPALKSNRRGSKPALWSRCRRSSIPATRSG
jgi:translation elongation factor P/translation initiation factor 5A